MELEFWKMSGAGNDFIVVDNRTGCLPEQGREPLFRAWCQRGVGIGADGVLLVEPSAMADFRMRYYNADGGEAETCGNGSRCIARFAYLRKIAAPHMRFETLAGIYEAHVRGEEVAVRMSDAQKLRLAISVQADVFTGTVHFINTGVPHVVIFTDELDMVPVEKVGRWLRYHELFAPAGTNVNFISVTGPQSLSIRTYERGVEAETLACGTGSIASAIVAARLGCVAPPVTVKTRSGDSLKIDFRPTDDGATNVLLEGPARVVFRGYVELPEPATT
ncbi:MAG: diaminopimelate epimerase [Candidatus Sumerlaeaceae bacterium]|nr:diaminopimelate epimerase [Candidatus Sumerlaeaceae bacterium]